MSDATLRRLHEACLFLVLTWRCETCGWETTLNVPGFGGDGWNHFPDGVHPCGPLVARRAKRESMPATTEMVEVEARKAKLT